MVLVLAACSLALREARHAFDAEGRAMMARMAGIAASNPDDAQRALALAAHLHPGMRVEWRAGADSWHAAGTDPAMMAAPRLFTDGTPDALHLYLDTLPLAQRRTSIYAWGAAATAMIIAAAALLILQLERLGIRPLRRLAGHLTAPDPRAARELALIGERIDRLEQQRAQSRQALQQLALEAIRYQAGANWASTDRARFLAVVGDRLRQPLQAMALFTDSLQRAGTLQTHDQAIVRVQQCAQAMRALLDELSMHARLSADVIITQAVPVGIDEVFEAVHREVAGNAKALAVELRWRGSGRVAITDPAMLQCMLEHLVHNAIDASPQGRVLVACRRHRDGVRIEVRDSGVGITRLHQAKVFDEFFQLSDGSQRRERKLGLGLSICARIASLLGSRILVRSELGRGSVFWFHLPGAPVADIAHGQDHLIDQRRKKTPTSTRRQSGPTWQPAHRWNPLPARPVPDPGPPDRYRPTSSD